MQREKLYSLQKMICFYYVVFTLKGATNSVLPVFHSGKRLVAQIFSVFGNKKSIIKINFSLQFVELFTLHLVVYFVFLEYSDIQSNNNKRIKMHYKNIQKNVVFESCPFWSNRLYRISQNIED